MKLDTTLIIVALITAFPPTIVALANLRATKELHKEVNSRMDQLLKSEKKESRAEGIKIGKKQKR